MLEYILIGLRSMGIYIFIIGAIRLLGKKELAQLSLIDLVLLMLISDSVQNAMIGGWKDFYIGLTSVTAILIFNYALKILFYKKTGMAGLIQGNPVMLIHEGKMIEKNMLDEKITIEELETAAREHGEAHLENVDLAVLERDGSISIISKRYQHRTNNKRKHYKTINKTISS
jgi:uncharacterized membrane protein YcaP (DUF421 family)